jgi:hypothetical protein
MKQKQQINIEQLGFHERLQHEMSSYPVRTVHEDSAVTIQHVKDPYFLVQAVWNVSFLETIPQFLEMAENYKGTNRNVHFRIDSPTVNLEVKYIWYQKLFRDEWMLGTAFGGYASNLKKLTVFLNEKYPTLHSLLDLDIEQVERKPVFK